MSNYSSNLLLLGKGSYGDVHSVKLNKTNEKIAIKRNFVRENISFLSSIKEIDFLARLRHHPNIIKLKSIYISDPFLGTKISKPSLDLGFKMDNVYFSMELGVKDGYNVMIDPKVNFENRKKIILDLILGLEYIHSMNIIHRDIKPSNFIQVVADKDTNRKFTSKEKMLYKWCDFGMSTNYTKQDIEEVDCIVTASFRAPEIAFGKKNYSTKSDMWSMGCLIIEILTNGEKHLLNLKDESVSKTLPLIILKRITPIPTKDDVKKLTEKSIRGKYDRKRPTLRRIMNLNKAKVAQFDKTGGNYEQLLDLLSKLIVLDPSERYCATQALNHPFFSSNKGYIKKIRLNGKPDIPKISIIDTKRRNEAHRFFGHLLPFSEYIWHRERVMFHAMRIYDRFLIYNKNVELDPEDIHLYLRVVYYISLKLFVPDVYIQSFFDFFDDVDMDQHEIIYNMEVHIVNDILSGKIYEMSLFEVPDIENDILTTIEKENLFKYYGSVSGYELDILALYKKYKKEYVK